MNKTRLISLQYVITKLFRPKRMKRFCQTLGPTNESRILDVGGTANIWQFSDCRPHVTLLNQAVPSEPVAPTDENFTYVVGDALDLKYDSGAYEIAFSNSVIEHVGSFDNQRQFAKEIRRVGQRLWVQTPARSFFMEPHLVTPFIHYFLHIPPRRIQRIVLRYFTVWGWVDRPSKEQLDRHLDQIRLLGFSEMKALFPDCEILTERFFGMPKSYIAVRT